MFPPLVQNALWVSAGSTLSLLEDASKLTYTGRPGPLDGFGLVVQKTLDLDVQETRSVPAETWQDMKARLSGVSLLSLVETGTELTYTGTGAALGYSLVVLKATADVHQIIPDAMTTQTWQDIKAELAPKLL